MKTFVGLDISSEKLDCYFLSDDKHLSILFESALTNDINVATEIKEKILSSLPITVFELDLST